jgi:hypothetical protein
MFSTTKTVLRKLPAFKTNFARLKPLSRRVSIKPYVDKYQPVSDDCRTLTVQLVRTVLRDQIPSPRIVNAIGHIVWGTSVVVKNTILCVLLPLSIFCPLFYVVLLVEYKLITTFVTPRSKEEMEEELARKKADPEGWARKEYYKDMTICMATHPWR